MTPEEKAEDLISIFLSLSVSHYDDINDGIRDGIRIPLAKKSALTAVDEILKTEINVDFYWDKTTKHIISFKEYYEEVKKELEKL
jgi:hypothetical protein